MQTKCKVGESDRWLDSSGMAPVEKQFDNAARQKFMAMYVMTLYIVHKLYIALLFRCISKLIWSMQLYKISKW